MIHHYSYSAPPVQAELISLSLQVSDIRCMSPRRRGQVVLSRVRGACRSRHSTIRVLNWSTILSSDSIHSVKWYPYTDTHFFAWPPSYVKGKHHEKKVLISDYEFNFVFVVSSFIFFISVLLISFILKCYPLFRVNLLHLKVVFHQVRVNLFCVNLQYLNFMER